MELRDQVQTQVADVLEDPAFTSAWDSVAGIEGWMTDGQAALLWSSAQSVGGGASAGVGRTPQIVEIGSYRGRSMTILATAAPDAASIVAIDPHAGNDRGPQQWEGTADEGQEDNDAFWANLAAAGVADRVRHVRAFSYEAHDHVDGPIDLLYVDGAHGYGPALDDLRTWGDRVTPGGVMLVHDCYSSIGVTLALLRTMTASGDWEYLGRTRSMGAWRRRSLTGAERLTNTGRQLVPLGWFARNVAVKAAIAGKVGPLARLLGSDGKTWPY